ncbi:adaptor protein MecA [Staphylococcus saccharolyticus]|uniref:adaptor protein MecA n=1 Tax=Staphylococcus saccharolyticus TaxID=33028 RepID=UPI0032DFA60C
MRIERVDDTTVKLFITYGDIEARGFSREDLWSNRKRGEEFFWSMMDEINEEEDFVVEGPLWIQVHAFEKGVEVTISKSKNDDAMNMSDDDTNNQFDDQVNELLAQTLDGEESLDDLFEQRNQQKKNSNDNDRQRTRKPSNVRNIIVKFEHLESVINYAHRNNQNTTEFEDLLYMIDNQYYYSIHFDDSVSQEEINDSYSQLLEFASPTDKTEIYLNDYGKIIMSHNVTSQVRRYFTDSEE